MEEKERERGRYERDKIKVRDRDIHLKLNLFANCDLKYNLIDLMSTNKDFFQFF
jgi:hypothetical protein